MSLDPIIAGCTWEVTLTVAPSVGRTNADVIADLTGATAAAHIYATKTDALPAATFSTSIDAASMAIGLSLGPTDTAALAEKNGYVMDVRVTTVDGAIRPVSVGTPVAVRRLSA